MPANNNHTLRADFDASLNLISKTAIFGSEVSPTSQLGIDREAIIVGLEGSNTVPIWTADINGVSIGPRKKPNP